MSEQKTQSSRPPFEKLKLFEVPKAPEWAVKPSETMKPALVKEGGSVSVSPDAPVENPLMFVGCNRNSQFKIDSEPKIARLHAGLLVDESGQWYVVGFSGTTTLNDAPVVQLQPTEIKDGDKLTFDKNGPYKFSLGGASKKREREEEGKETEEAPAKKERRVEPVEVRCCHLLVKHRDSRRPASWKSPVITRSKEEAIEILKGFRDRIEKGEVRFQDLARVESDCSSAKHGGDLGFFRRGMMQREFEDVAFALDVGQMSDIVSTQSGVHIILRVE